MADDFYDPYAVFASGSGYGGRLYDDPAQFAAATTPQPYGGRMLDAGFIIPGQPVGGNDGGLLGRLFGFGRPQQYGGLFGQLTGGQQQVQPGMLVGKRDAPGGATGIAGSNDELLNQLIRRQLEQSMRPNWGKMAAAFAEAGKPSLLPTGGMGRAIGMAAGAMSDDDAGGMKTMQMLKLAQEVKNAQQLAALRNMTPAQIHELMKDIGGWASGGGSAGTTPGGGGQGGPARAVASMTADATMEPEQRALLDSIAGPESRGAYNARWPSKTFELGNDHPRIYEPGPEGPSSAAGRYQIVASTYDKFGGGPFNEVGQDRMAWKIASTTYQQQTGRDLLADLKAGRTQQIAGALAGQWPTIGRAMGAYDANLAKYSKGGAAIGSADEAPSPIPVVPNFAARFRGDSGGTYDPNSPLGAPSPAPAASPPPGGPAGAPGQPPLVRGTGSGPDGMLTADEYRRSRELPPVKIQPLGSEAVPAAPSGGPNLVAGGVLGALARGPQAAAPVPGVLAPPTVANPVPQAPPPPPPPAPGQTPPMAPGGPPGGAMPSMVPQNIPMPNTQATQALLGKLAAMRAWSEMVGLGDVYKPFQDMVLNSPRYLAEKTATEKGAAIPYQYLEPGANVGLQAQLEWVKAQSQQLAKYLGPEANAKLQGEIEEAKARGKAGVEAVQTAWAEWVKGQGGTPVEVTMMGPDGKTPTKYKMTPNQFVQMQTGQVGPAVPPPGMFGPTPGAPAAAPAAPPLSPTGLTTGGGGGFTPGQQVGERVYDPGQKQEAEARGTAIAKREQEYRDAADLARETKSTLTAVAADLNNVVKGPWANTAQTFMTYARLLDPSFNTQVSSYEGAQSAVNALVRKAVRESDPNPTFLQTKMAIESMPSPLQSEGGSQKIAGRMVGFANHNIARAAAMQQWLDDPKNNGSLSGFDANWRAKVSPFAFVFLQMDATEQQMLGQYLSQTKQGERERARLLEQVRYIRQNGLEQ